MDIFCRTSETRKAYGRFQYAPSNPSLQSCGTGSLISAASIFGDSNNTHNFRSVHTLHKSGTDDRLITFIDNNSDRSLSQLRTYTWDNIAMSYSIEKTRSLPDRSHFLPAPLNSVVADLDQDGSDEYILSYISRDENFDEFPILKVFDSELQLISSTLTDARLKVIDTPAANLNRNVITFETAMM